VTLSEQNYCRKIGFRCGAKAQQVEHEHESPNFGNWDKPTSEIPDGRWSACARYSELVTVIEPV
jgi:hypothetical protein